MYYMVSVDVEHESTFLLIYDDTNEIVEMPVNYYYPNMQKLVYGNNIKELQDIRKKIINDNLLIMSNHDLRIYNDNEFEKLLKEHNLELKTYNLSAYCEQCKFESHDDFSDPCLLCRANHKRNPMVKPIYYEAKNNSF